MNSRRLMIKPVLAALIGAGVLGAAVAVPGSHPAQIAPAALSPVVAGQPAPAQAARNDSLPDFATMAEHVGPAVVHVSVRARARPAAFEGKPGEGGMEEFFRRFAPPGAVPGNPFERPPRERMANGSGFIVSADGLVLTNAHVVDEADEVVVRLSDRREFTAKVLGADERTDVAVLKIDGTDLPHVRIGDPDSLRAGEWVMAIGSPFGFDRTVTVGVVSATDRSMPNGQIVPFIQSDVAVNPGNSGGPLFNARGEVIGINSQIFSRTGGYQGLSFAIPIDLAQRVQKQIVENGKVRHARLGVAIQPVTPALAQAFGLENVDGALVSEVGEDTAASRAGIEPGDVIMSVDGEPVTTSSDLPSVISLREPGSKVALQVMREGKAQTIEVTLMALDGEVVAAADEAPGTSDARLGLTVRDLTEAEKAQGLEQGVRITAVDGAARRAGLQAGDVVVSVDRKKVDSAKGLADAVRKKDSPMAFLIEREGRRIYVPVKVG